MSVSAGRDGSVAGAVDEEDFIQAFEDVPTVQVWSLVHSDVFTGVKVTWFRLYAHVYELSLIRRRRRRVV